MRALLFASIVTTLGAVPHAWTMYQGGPAHNAAFAAGEPAYAWRYDAGAKINGGLAIAGETVYFDTFAPAVVALDRRTGRVRWRTPLSDVAMTTPIVADGLAIVGTGTNRVARDDAKGLIWGRPGGDAIVALDAGSGRVRWTYPTVGEDMPSPALVRVGGRDAVAFANGDDRVRALDVRTGRLLWSTPVQGVATMSSAAAAAGRIYVVAGLSAASHRPDRTYALRARDGAVVWSAPYGNADASPTVAGGLVFVEDAQTVNAPPQHDAFNTVYAIETAAGRRRWSYTSPYGFFTRTGSSELAIAGMADGDTLYQSLPAARRFAAFDLQTGRLRWSARTAAAVKMSAVARNGIVYVGDTSGIFYAFDAQSGRVRWRRSFDEGFTCSSPVAIGSTLYVPDGRAVVAMAL